MNRPYSLEELQDLEKDLYVKHRLSDIVPQFTCRVCTNTEPRKEDAKNNFCSTTDRCSTIARFVSNFKASRQGGACREVVKDRPLWRVSEKIRFIFSKWLYRHEYA